MRSMISVRGLVKRFEGRDIVRNAVDGISFEIPEGKLFTLLGPSGCGKTTTLRMIAGLERPTAGEIEIDEKLVDSGTKPAPSSPQIGGRSAWSSSRTRSGRT